MTFAVKRVKAGTVVDIDTNVTRPPEFLLLEVLPAPYKVCCVPSTKGFVTGLLWLSSVSEKVREYLFSGAFLTAQTSVWKFGCVPVCSARGDALPTGEPSLPVFSAVLCPHLPTSVG